ncbi:MAG: hypothetical protein ABI623_03535 [bacterium]
MTPVTPTWDVSLTVPLANKLYTLADIIAKDTSVLKIGAGSQISISKQISIPPTYVSDKLSLSPKDTSLALQFGAFDVNSPDQRTPINISWMPQGQTVPIPDTTMTFADIRSKIPAFENITLRSGTITLNVLNNLPVAMDIQGPIRLMDLQGRVVATFVFNPSTIPPRSSRSASDDLGSKTFDSDYRITGLQFHTPGSRTPVTIPNGDLLVATMSTSNLKASRATLADIPAQRLADNDTARLHIDDSTLVKELYLKNGSLRFAFVSNVSLGMIFKFRFLELQRRVGGSYIPYEDSLYLGPNGSGSLILDLSNTRIKSLTPGLLTSLKVLSTVAINASLGVPVTVSETDRISIAVTKNTPIVIDSAVAVLKPTWVTIDTKIGFNLGAIGQKFTGQLNLPAASLVLGSISSLGFPSDLYLKIGARKNAAGDSVFLNFPASQRRISPGQDQIQFDPVEVGRFLSQLNGKLPDSLRIVGRALVNPNDVYDPTLAGVGSVGLNSGISGSVDLNVPLSLGIVAASVRDTLAIGDTTGDGHKDFTLDKEKTKYYNSGKVYVEIENRLPVGVSVNVALLNRAFQNILSVPQSGVPISFGAAPVDAGGNVIAAAKSTRVIELSKQEVEQYNPAEFVSYSVNMNTPGNGPAVKFKTSDNVRVRVWSNLSVRVQ